MKLRVISRPCPIVDLCIRRCGRLCNQGRRTGSHSVPRFCAGHSERRPETAWQPMDSSISAGFLGTVKLQTCIFANQNVDECLNSYPLQQPMFFSISWNDGVGSLGRIAPFLFLGDSVFLVHVVLGQFSHKKHAKTIKNPWFWSIVGTSPCRIHGLPSLKPGSLGAYKGFSDMNGNNDRGHKYSTWSWGPTAEVLPNRHVMNGICKQQ